MKSDKIKVASFNNRKKTLRVDYVSGKTARIHFSQIGIQDNISEVWVDRETRGKSLGIRLINGREEFMPYDQPLALIKDSDFLLQNHIEHVIAHIHKAITSKKISKRYLAEQLNTSDNQIQRLLNPSILNKNLEQLYKIATLLGLEMEWGVKKKVI